MGYVTYKNQRVKLQTIDEKSIGNFAEDFSKFMKNYKFTDIWCGSSTISETDLYFMAAWKKSRIHCYVSHIIQLVCVSQPEYSDQGTWQRDKRRYYCK